MVNKLRAEKPKTLHEDHLVNWRIAILTYNAAIMQQITKGSYTIQDLIKETASINDDGFIHHISANGLLEFGISPQEVRMLHSLHLNQPGMCLNEKFFMLDVKKLREIVLRDGILTDEAIKKSGILHYGQGAPIDVFGPNGGFTPAGAVILRQAEEEFVLRNQSQEKPGSSASSPRTAGSSAASAKP